MFEWLLCAFDGERLLTNASEVLCRIGSGSTESIIS